MCQSIKEAEKINGFQFIKPQPPPPKLEVPPPKPGRTTRPNQPKNFWIVPEVYKMAKVQEDGRLEKMGKKSVFHSDF